MRVPVALALGVLWAAGAAANELDLTDLAARASQFVLPSNPIIPTDPTNAFSGNPEAQSLGQELFFDTGLSASGTVACASCHVTNGAIVPNETLPAGVSRKFRSVMPIAGLASQEFFFWDGRVDSLWAQALEPLEHPDEHGLTRTEVVAYVLDAYPDALSTLLGEPLLDRGSLITLPVASPKGTRIQRATWQDMTEPSQARVNSIFASIGKAIAAFEETLLPDATAWDRIAKEAIRDPNALRQLPESALRGFDLFSGKARCSSCHSGPFLTDGDFHNTGMPERDGATIDMGRQAVVAQLKYREFSCLSIYSDSPNGECPKVEYLSLAMERALGTFKTPSLRGVTQRTVFGHSGQF
ncbi:MAG: cytochrome c peroxidase, partial [Celeribacter marinus]